MENQIKKCVMTHYEQYVACCEFNGFEDDGYGNEAPKSSKIIQNVGMLTQADSDVDYFEKCVKQCLSLGYQQIYVYGFGKADGWWEAEDFAEIIEV